MEQRPHIKKAKVGTSTSEEEVFQNTVLRQIIKMKHELLVLHTRNHIVKKKKDFSALNDENKLKYLNSIFEKDQNFRSELRGIVIGHFTAEEYVEYGKISQAINRRILKIIQKRMIEHSDDLGRI